jgi:uncharacterized membrane protein
LLGGNHVLAAEYHAIDVTPSGYVGVSVEHIFDTQCVGTYQIDDPNSPMHKARLHWKGPYTMVMDTHAFVWDRTTGNGIDLNPSGYNSSTALATNGTQQVGIASQAFTGMCGNFSSDAILWTGTAESAIKLTPSGFGSSIALGICGTQQVGYGSNMAYALPVLPPGLPAYFNHALLWTGTAESAVDLNPSGYSDSYATNTNGVQQVGYGLLNGCDNRNDFHALLWSGTAASAVDLHPAQFKYSLAFDIGGTQEVGYGVGSDNMTHAVLWRGTAASAVDLNGSRFLYSEALDTNGAQQVGIASIDGGQDHAVLWSGTADSAIDLHLLLEGDYVGSKATSIDEQGNVIGSAWDSAGNEHTIVWANTAIPEPGTLSLLGMGVAGLLACSWRWNRKTK